MYKGKRILAYTFIASLALVSEALAGNKLDSLRHVIQTTENDTIKLKTINVLSRTLYFTGNPDSSMFYAKQARELAEKLLSKSSSLAPATRLLAKKESANALNYIGEIYVAQGNFTEAKKYDTAELRLAKETGDKKLIANAYGNLGALYTCAGNYGDALNNEFKALNLDEETGNKRGMVSVYTNIGNTYLAEKNYKDALENHQKCLEVSKEIGDKHGMAAAYNNLGDIYEQQDKHEEALVNYEACLKVGKEINDKEVIGASYANIGGIYYELDLDNEGALRNELAAKEIFQSLGSKQNVVTVDNYIGEIYLKEGKYKEAEGALDTTLALSLESGYKEVTKQTYKDLSSLYETLAKKGESPAENWKKAHEDYKKYVLFNDSLFNASTRQKSIQAQMQFEFDKKEAVAKEEQEKKDALLTQQRQKQKVIVYCLSTGFLLVLALAFLIYRGYRMKRRANITISIQKDEVEQKNLIIEAKNKSITDSINYARLIQRSILTPEEEITKALREYFILYKPKDIVSGDFYFYRAIQQHGGTRYLAACDCTGHGVPGAFMSMIGHEKLNDAVTQFSDTGEILSLLNKQIKFSLHQSSAVDSSRDGMDIALCSITPNSKGEGQGWSLSFSGANRPLWIARKGKEEIEEIRPTKKSIGGLTEESTLFESHNVELKNGDAFYMFTDGFCDQFGGLNGKKLTTRKFKELIFSIRNYAMQEQNALLKKFFAEWMGENEQLDDILVIGVRV